MRLSVIFRCPKCRLTTPTFVELPDNFNREADVVFTAKCFHCDAPLKKKRKVKDLVCSACGGTGVMKGDATAPADSILRVDVPCPECQDQ